MTNKLYSFQGTAREHKHYQKNGKMEELEKGGVALLGKIREVIGDESDAENSKIVLAGFPVFNTFNACVDIIVVETDKDCLFLLAPGCTSIYFAVEYLYG
jgi:hypothetical protein